jgi:hypothetical protein
VVCYTWQNVFKTAQFYPEDGGLIGGDDKYMKGFRFGNMKEGHHFG